MKMHSTISGLGLAVLLVAGVSVAQHNPAAKADQPRPVQGSASAAARKAEVDKRLEAQLVPSAQSGRRPVPGRATGGNRWFEVTNRDLGTFYGTGEAVGLFPFKNPHDEPIDWRSLAASCQCAKAEIRFEGETYRLISKPTKRLVRVFDVGTKTERIENVRKITIGPNVKGEVECHLDMRNITGAKYATLDIHSTDPTLPHTKLTFRAKGAQLFAISPKEVQLNKMTWNEQREFSVTVTSPLQKDWQILSMDKADEAFDVTWEKNKLGDRTQWVIKGKYGPLGKDAAGGGVLRFQTDINNRSSFDVRVLAYVQGPLDVKPGGFLTLGLIRKGKKVAKDVVFTPNDGADLQATALEFEKLTLDTQYIKATQHKDGDNLIVSLEVSDSAPKGLVKGELVIKLNHPLVTEKRIMFNGFVR